MPTAAGLRLWLQAAKCGLAQTLRHLAELLLEHVRLNGHLLQVVIDLVDVVAAKAKAKLDGAEGLKDGLR